MASDVLWVLGQPYEPHLTSDTGVRWALGAPYPPALLEGVAFVSISVTDYMSHRDAATRLVFGLRHVSVDDGYDVHDQPSLYRVARLLVALTDHLEHRDSADTKVVSRADLLLLDHLSHMDGVGLMQVAHRSVADHFDLYDSVQPLVYGPRWVSPVDAVDLHDAVSTAHRRPLHVSDLLSHSDRVALSQMHPVSVADAYEAWDEAILAMALHYEVFDRYDLYDAVQPKVYTKANIAAEDLYSLRDAIFLVKTTRLLIVDGFNYLDDVWANPVAPPITIHINVWDRYAVYDAPVSYAWRIASMRASIARYITGKILGRSRVS